MDKILTDIKALLAQLVDALVGLLISGLGDIEIEF